MNKNFIQLKNITKIFGDSEQKASRLIQQGFSKKEILKKLDVTIGVNQVSLEIERGELFVIMGLSGSGKSTLLRCLNRLIEPSSGKVIIDGTDVTELSHSDLLNFRQRKIAMVFQNFALLPHRNVLENIAFPLELQQVNKEERMEIAKEKLKLVGLDGWGEKFPHELSGGMQQRVGLARALTSDPEILLMDEAFSALDPLIREEMQDELLNLQQTLNKTIIFVSHDLNEALRIGTRIALMKDGEVVQIGTPDDIITNPKDEYVAKFVRGVDVSKILVAQDIMKTPRPLLQAKEGPHSALRHLKDESLSSAFVVNTKKQLIGLVTLEELTSAAKEKRISIESCMFEDILTVPLETPLSELILMIVQTKYPLAVIDENKLLKGLIFKSAILEAIANQGGEEIEKTSSL